MRRAKTGFKKFLKSLLSAAIARLALYLLQFFLIPVFIFPNPQDNIAHIVIICATSAVVGAIVVMVFDVRLRYLCLTIPLYYVFVILYHPELIYGIGYGEFILRPLPSLGLALWCAVILLTETCVCSAASIYAKIRAKKN